MIWFCAALFVLAIFVYIAAPLYAKSPLSEDAQHSAETEIDTYRTELKSVNARLAAGEPNDAALLTQKRILEKRLVKAATQSSAQAAAPKKPWIAAIFAVLIAGTFGTYAMIGAPELSSDAALQTPVLSAPQAMSQQMGPDVQHENNASMEDLLAQLKQKLDADDQNPQGWILYARSLMTLERYEEAFAAYEKTLALTDGNPNVIEELASARAYAAQQQSGEPLPALPEGAPGPSREDMDAAAAMSGNDRAAMIQGMVDGLAERLADNPDDPAGWIRLLRARNVLGQTEVARGEVANMKAHFAGQPDTIADILAKSGWAE